MPKQVIIVDDKTFDEAISLIDEGAVNIMAKYKSFYHVKDTEEALNDITELLDSGQRVTVEQDLPADQRAGATPVVHKILPREYECPGCHKKTKVFENQFTKEEEKGIEWATCKSCSRKSSMMAI